ncbi:MAG TPA: GNAT family N-acetyltransferase [Candidatus Eremiobacteraceae bacterium]|nr:GNAT family N-acetyltransferase [Candidatus Eremiobacteraceae bacterium]
MVTNMVVELAHAPLDTADDEAALARSGITLVNKRGADREEQAWIRRTFTPTWAKEAYYAWNWFARDRAGAIVGFASYEQRHYRWWWLRAWSHQNDVGIFGPVGVNPALRGKHIGCVLTRRALESIKRLGYTRAVIPRVGPIEFYRRCCNAQLADQVRLFGIF